MYGVTLAIEHAVGKHEAVVGLDKRRLDSPDAHTAGTLFRKPAEASADGGGRITQTSEYIISSILKQPQFRIGEAAFRVR